MLVVFRKGMYDTQFPLLRARLFLRMNACKLLSAAGEVAMRRFRGSQSFFVPCDLSTSSLCIRS